MANLGLLQAVSHKLCRGPVHLGSSGANLRRVEGSHWALASNSGWLGALTRGRLRGPNRLGNLVMPGLLGWAFGWRLSARTTRRVRSPDIQRVIGRLVDELPEEGLAPRLVDSYWAKGAAIMVCHDESTKDWLAARVPTLVAWEGSRLKLVSLDALPTYKRVVAWFPGPVENVERYLLQLCRLNQGLDTRHWTVYELRGESNGVCLVLSIDEASVSVLEGLGWRPFSGVGQATFSLLSVKPEGKK